MRGIAGILLAAGCGSRFGANKLLAPLADGTPLAIAALKTFSVPMTFVRTVLGDIAQGERRAAWRE